MGVCTIANGGGVWTTGSTWVGGVAPTAADDVVATATSGSVTVSTNGVCRSLDLTGYANTITINSTRSITIGDGTAGAGNVALKISATTVFSLGTVTTSKIVFASTSTTVQTITSNGVTGLPMLEWTGSVGAKYQFTDNYTTISGGRFTLTDGQVDLNGKTLTCSNGIFSISGSNARVFICTNSTVEC